MTHSDTRTPQRILKLEAATGGLAMPLLVCLALAAAGCERTPGATRAGEDETVEAATSDTSLPPIPAFPHDAMEPAVRAQFEQAKAALDQNPGDAQSTADYGMLFQAYDLPGLAEACYRRALASATAKAPGQAQWMYLLGVVLAEQGETEESLRMFETVLRSRPEDVAATYRLAELSRASGDGDRALQGYLRAIELSPSHAQAHCGAAHALLQLRRLDDAEQHARQAIELTLAEGGAFGRAHYVLGQVLRELGRADEAKAEFALAEQYRGREPALPDPLMLSVQRLATGTIDALRRGVELMLQGQVSDAMPLLEKAVALHPDLAEAHGQLGSALLVSGDIDRAETSLRRAVELNPTYTDALYNLGQLEYQRGRPAEAAAMFERAVKLQPEYVEAQRGLGTVLPLLGRHDEAMDHLRKAIGLRPDDDRPYKQLAALLTEGGRDGEAVGVLRDAAARIPGDLSIRDRLAWSLATSSDPSVRNPDEALKLAAEVAEQTTHPRPMATLAAAQAASGDMETALQTARNALSAAQARRDEQLIEIIQWMIQGMESGLAPGQGSRIPGPVDG